MDVTKEDDFKLFTVCFKRNGKVVYILARSIAAAAERAEQVAAEALDDVREILRTDKDDEVKLIVVDS